ncbi:zinc finger protein 28 homolog [Sipha flava]|uniref:Zinc finger protein 28 homolog n=1 Tax=Sipha flava TaxID=143950 RepID=A0A8B8FGF9_9HEMI|nr:zinc finger protein 28 homolog [Sipha flava]
MNIYTDYSQKCPDCRKSFYSATSLLVHFFSHVSEKQVGNTINNENSSVHSKKTEDNRNNGSSKLLNFTKDETFNPWKYCLATYEENIDNSIKPLKKIKVHKKKKEKDKTFECSLCKKKFGWPTDLKRHLLIHTGERPFKCNSCQAAFTRNFLLQKHFVRAHKRVSEDESKKLDNHVHANVAEIKLKMKELECQKEHSKSVPDSNDH